MFEEIGLRDRFPSGECLDILIGPRGQRLWVSPWQCNLIAEGLRRLLAALVKGDPQGAPLEFWAVGTGEEAWDDGALPSEETRRTRTQLFNETGRKLIPPGQVTFLGGDFTNRLEISIEFTAAGIPPGPGSQNWRANLVSSPVVRILPTPESSLITASTRGLICRMASPCSAPCA